MMFDPGAWIGKLATVIVMDPGPLLNTGTIVDADDEHILVEVPGRGLYLAEWEYMIEQDGQLYEAPF